MHKRFLAVLLVMSEILCAVAQNYTISGYLLDAESGETLIQATVYDRISGKGAVSNLYGFYSLTLPAGEVDLTYSYVGYLPEHHNFKLEDNKTLTVRLAPNVQLEAVVVTGRENTEIGVQGTQMSTVEIPVSQIKALPTLFGENDVLKALQLLPGVQGGMEGTTGMYVRGGGPDENLMLLDGVPVYNVNHAGGMFSVFNADAIKNVTLYKGNFPARFGGRLSSVVDVRMKDGDEHQIHGNASIGLISSKLSLNGPIVKEKTTFNVSFRRTYSDLVMKPALAIIRKTQDLDVDKLNGGYYFYDFNAKIAHKFSEKDRLFLSYYMGDDGVYAKVKTRDVSTNSYEEREYLGLDTKWGNMVSALRWNHVVNPKMFINTTAAYTRYRFGLGVSYDTEEKSESVSSSQNVALGYHTGIDDYTIKTDIDYTPDPRHVIKLGANYTFHNFRPGVSVISMEEAYGKQTMAVDTSFGDTRISSHEVMCYVEDNIDVFDFLKFNVGLHYSNYTVDGQFYQSLQPRLGARLLFTDDFSAKLGYSRMSQYIHLLSSSNLSLPTDLWVPVTRNILPMKSDQYSAGLFYDLNGKVDFSLEGYYKSMDNLIEYKDGASFLGSTTGWEEKVCMGRGWSYGLEFLAQKSFGKTTGWIGYTWSKSERLFDRPGQELNGGKVFPAKYDRRHDLNITMSHRFNDRIDASATWVYSTGNCATLAMQNYEYDYYEYDYISGRNNYRYNDYHRLDLGVNFHKEKRHGTRTWSIGVYNAYNQKNPFMVYQSYDYRVEHGEWKGYNELAQLTVFTILPSISYGFEF